MMIIFIRGKGSKQVKCYCYKSSASPPETSGSGSDGSGSDGSGPVAPSGSGSEPGGNIIAPNCPQRPASRTTPASEIQPSSKSEFDIFDEFVTYSNFKYEATCCRLDGSSVTVSCGQGVRLLIIIIHPKPQKYPKSQR